MSKYKILWIEDDANMIMGLMRPLLKEGCEIDTALDLEKAKQRLKEKKYNLIVLDIILPSGKDLRSKEDFMDLERFYGLKLLESMPIEFPPILVLTVVTDEEIIEYIKSFPKVKKVVSKGMLKPSELKEKVLGILESK